MNTRWADKYAAILLALPLIFYLLIFTAYPMVESVILSFSKVGLLYEFKGLVGLQNYQTLISNVFFRQTFINTLIFVFAVVVIDMLSGLILALSLERISRGKSVITTILMSPMILPAVVVGAIWEVILAPYIGPVDYLLSRIGFGNIGWLANPRLALPSLIVISVWQSIPFIFLLILAGVQSIPQQLKEAAKIDGLSTSQIFSEITMPMILPAFAVSFLMALINSFRVFDIIYVIDQGGFNPANSLLTYFSYEFAFIPGFQGVAMAAIIIITLIATVVAMFFINRVGLRERLGLKEASNSVKRFKLGIRLPSFNIPPGISKILAYFILIVASIISFFPFLWAIITSLNTTGIVTTLLPPVTDIGLDNFVKAIYQGAGYLASSLVIAPVVAGITILIAAPASYAIARYKLGGTKLLSWNLYIYAIPSIVFLIPLYLLVGRLGLLNTWWALMLIYPIFTIPLATWILVGFYSDVPKEIDEAALVDGKSKLGAFFSIILPIVKPALAVVAFFSILASYTEFMFALTIGETPYLFNFPPRGTETATVFIAIGVSYGAGHPINYALLAAAGLIVSIPVIIISAVLQKYIVKGLGFGTIKG
ncbi:MAG: ABC transporter permease subunit [Nitrososphaerota archaeon]|nr:ABC transporter permease subunit [Nitrososphaerota archaeon]MDG6935631.1 ABC transporter permease subunit [Nitrososphaerota archaeon]MDG6943546.1 ABC transporter permease subunit [Nitrososphaerota archaeon]